MTKQALKLCEMSWDFVCLCTSCSTCDVISQQQPGSLFRFYVGDVSSVLLMLIIITSKVSKHLHLITLANQSVTFAINDIKVSFCNQ